MHTQVSRRTIFKVASSAACAGISLSLSPASSAASSPGNAASFRYGLNTSTLRGQKLPLDQEIEIIAQAGYSGFEPWIGEIESYKKSGGSLADLKKRIADHGLTVAGGIGFANWVVDDESKRKQGLEQAKRDMDLLKQIGGTHMAAPPAGATNQTDLNLLAAAERYRALLEIGDEMGVIPEVEVWGFSKSLSRLGEVMLVAMESGHPKACILPDVYHLYKGGSSFNGLKLIQGSAIPAIHMNDYPADPPRDQITDADRVYPGDGVAPLSEILRDLQAAGFKGFLSLELFNRAYWQQDALDVAKLGLSKMKAAVVKAMA